MAEVGVFIEVGKGIKEIYKWWKKRKGKVFRVLIRGEERIIRIKGIPEELGGHFILVEDIIAGEKPMFLDVREIKPIKELTEKEAKMFSKRLDLFKGIHLIKKLTQKNGGVLSHENSIALPSPSAQSLLALSELEKLFPGQNIISKEELEKRVKWLSELEEWRDWEGHKFNCFVASTCAWALSRVFDSISDPELKDKMSSSVEKTSLFIIDNFNSKIGGWSWSKEVEPCYPFYTFFAIKALREAKKILPNHIKKKIAEIELSVISYFRNFLIRNKDPGSLAMCLWGIYEIEGEASGGEEILSDIYTGIEKMEAIPLHTKPIEFHLHFFMPMAVIPMILVAPNSPYTLKCVQRVFRWIKETQEEGWSWAQIDKDASWATAWVLLIFAYVIKSPKLLQGLF